MTHQEKEKITKKWYDLASGWDTDFVIKQFKLTWEVQKMLKEDKDAWLLRTHDLLAYERACQSIVAKRNGLVKVLLERGVC